MPEQVFLADFTRGKYRWFLLLIMLFCFLQSQLESGQKNRSMGNIIGCLLVSLLSRLSPIELGATAQKILESRLAIGPLRAGLLAIGCGFIMTTVVTFAREGKMLPLLFGVPLFINCGFPHCLADAFYYLTVPVAYTGAHLTQLLVLYPCLVVGNFVGCNLYRFIAPKQ